MTHATPTGVTHATWRVVEGDCIEQMAALPGSSVDAIVTDPPYGLGFMGKQWDSPGKSFVERKAESRNTFDHVGGNHNPVNSADAARTRRVEGSRYQAWCEQWAREALRVLKPGGHLLAFGGTRTYHRLACAVEDAGFEIRDCLAWLYGSGFPKSLDVSKAIDKAAGAARAPGVEGPYSARRPREEVEAQAAYHDGVGDYGSSLVTAPATPDAERWQGWGTALKPAHEPIVMARKPLSGTVAATILRHGTGGLNIDGCRITGDSSEGIGRETDPRGCPVHGLRGMRHADAPMEVASTPSEVADDMRAEVHGDRTTGRGESPLEERRMGGHPERLSATQDGRTLGGGSGATSNADATAVPGAPDGGSPDAGAPVEAGGTRSPHQRDEDRQPPGESNADGLGGALAGAPDGATSARASGSGEQDPARCTCVPRGRIGEPSAERRYAERGGTSFTLTPGPRGGAVEGRWPANVVLDEQAAAMLDEQTGELHSQDPATRAHGGKAKFDQDGWRTERGAEGWYSDSGGASRFLYVAKASSEERNRGLDGFPTQDTGKMEDDAYEWAVDGKGNPRSAPTRARNTHPTVKPVELMRWLARLVTPPGGTVLDPFTGSGTTGIAALREGFSFVGIEREAEYVAIARARIIGDAPLINSTLEEAAMTQDGERC